MLFSLSVPGSISLAPGQEVESETACAEVGEAVAWWTFEGRPEDSIGTVAASGSVSGTPVVARGKVGNGLDLHLAEDGIAFGGMEALAAGNFTIETWLRTERPEGTAELIRWRVQEGTYVVALDGGRPRVQLHDGSIRTGEADLSDGRWHHVAFVVSRNDTMAVQAFVDGDPLPLIPGKEFGLNEDIRASIGGLDERAFIGMLDELTVYARALRRTEVVSIWAAGGAGKCRSETRIEPDAASSGRGPTHTTTSPTT